jgi:MFS family permease
MASNVGKKYILLISAGGSILAPFMVSSLIVAIPTIGREFSMRASEMSVLATAFFLAASMFLVPFGRLADIYGVKKIFGFGICIYFVSALLAALCSQFPGADLCSLLDGRGSGHDLRHFLCPAQPLSS